MHRRDFIIKGSIATIFGNTIITSTNFITNSTELPPISQGLKDRFLATMQWMQENGWMDIVKKVANVTPDLSDPLHAGYFAPLQLDLKAWEGCDDFAGKKLIEPGNPALSLLYHLLASPRVLLSSGFYPSLESIDVLEDFIYALQPIPPGKLDKNKFVLAVFAYEYRPACKTPHESHADLVFSRTGFSRIGTRPMAAYDRKNRCFMNLPDNSADEREIAVTPARYGLFLAQSVPYNKVSRGTLINLDVKNNQHFLIPVRKIFKDDIYLQGQELFFSESHINEKLRKLCITKGLDLPSGFNFDLNKAPFVRVSNSVTKAGRSFPEGKYDNTLVKLTPVGSSVLLSSEPFPLARRAFQDMNGKQERLRMKIPLKEETGDLIKYSNRRYTSLKVLNRKQQNIDSWDIARANIFWPKRVITDYNSHRNAPMFVNIREIVSEGKGDIVEYLSPEYPFIEKKIDESYWVGLFEDNICDGCIFPEIAVAASPVFSDKKYEQVSQQLLALQRLPAFSIVTAPDFFPLVESYDMKPYKDLFLIGGVEDMGGARKRANPEITLPGSQQKAFPQTGSGLEEQIEETVVALISHPKHAKGTAGASQIMDQADKLTRTNFLPDSATKIFYPGWDATYSGGLDDEGKQHGTFYATYGLGSPFVEDSKLCGAANGMWAAASPDSARTFRASLSTIPTSLTKEVLPPTAVPLLDDELGYHDGSPAVKDYELPASTGWDGEQGPYVYKDNNAVWVNFTNIGRADYVQNALHDKFDMSRLRKITTKEVKQRMSALQKCFRRIDQKSTALWLIGAEKVENWQTGAEGHCLSESIFGENRGWITKGRNSNSTDGYLYLFAKTTGNTLPIDNSKRMHQECDELYVFQVSGNIISCCKLKKQTNWQPQWM